MVDKIPKHNHFIGLDFVGKFHVHRFGLFVGIDSIATEWYDWLQFGAFHTLW